MTRLPVLSGRECVKALQKAGFSFVRQRGSHMILVREEPSSQLTIPDHTELDRGTLRGIIRQAGLSVEEFRELLK
ncbi:MAG: type II toxin-antitoxin system HicA family toxin [Fimbriimonadia bacterium]|nr:type II toxin-antitoxin system HicA family toxin [Fimbriimonadia bacterium]